MVVVGNELEHHGQEGKETRSGYYEVGYSFEPLTAQNDDEDEQIKRNPKDDENRVTYRAENIEF